jgi:hypothetical protein
MNDQERSLTEAWRRAGLALGDLGTDVGDSLREAWSSQPPRDPEEAADALRRLADVFERSAATARDTAASPEARQRVNEGAREAGSAIDNAVRLSLAELGRALQRFEPRDDEPER